MQMTAVIKQVRFQKDCNESRIPYEINSSTFIESQSIYLLVNPVANIYCSPLPSLSRAYVRDMMYPFMI